MKSNKLRNILRAVVCTIIGAYVLLLGILNFGPSEQWITHTIAQALSEKLGTEVSISRIEVGLFNRLIIRDLEIKDLKGKQMLSSHVASAKIELRSLFKEQLSLRTVSLLDSHINLYKEKADSAANYQFVIDALSSKDKTKKSKLNLRINSIIMRRVNVAYNELYAPHTPGKFNTKHLMVSNINTNISLKSITNSAINLRIRSLSFHEASGLQVNDLHFKLYASKTEARIEDFCLEMPHTHINQGQLIASYDVSKNFSSLLSTLRIGATSNKMRISTTDLKPFVHFPEGMNLTLDVSSTFFFTPQKWQFSQLCINDTENRLSVNGNITIDHSKKAFQNTKFALSSLCISQTLINDVAQWVKLPKSTADILSRIGNVNANGNLSYEKAHIESTLFAKTSVGEIAADATFNGKKIDARAKLFRALPDKMLNNDKIPSQATLSTHFIADLSQPKRPRVDADGTITSFVWNNYTYRNIGLKLHLANGHIASNIRSNDPNAHLQVDAQALLNNGKVSNIALQGHIAHIAPATLGLNSGFHNATFSGDIHAQVDNLQNLFANTMLHVKNFNMQNSQRGDYALQNLEASIHTTAAHEQKLTVRSDFLDADLSGNLNPANIKQGLFAIANKCLPGLVKTTTNAHTTTNLAIDATLKRTDFLHKMLGVDINVDGTLRAQGNIHTGDAHSSLTIFADKIAVGGQEFIRPSIYLHGENDNYHCLLQTRKNISRQDYSIATQLDTHDGELTTNVSWRGTNDASYNGSFESITRFLPTEKGVNFDMHIQPTEFALADTLWNISSGNISYINKQLGMKGVSLVHDNQSLTINGEIAPGHNDSIIAQLQNIDIDYILQLVKFDAVSFGGQATGQAVFTQKDGQPQLHATLNVPRFTFNDGEMGNAHINANWNKHENRINLDADMQLPHTSGHGTHVDGYVSLAEKGLDLYIQANHTRLDFLRRYIDGIFGNFNAEATGAVRLYGPFKKLDFDGEVEATGNAKVMATGVTYHIDKGKVLFTPSKFAFHNFALTDGRGGTGLANGELRHKHLRNLQYDFDITAQRLLCYDQPQEPSLPFYSTTTGSGSIGISGYPGHLVANIIVEPCAPTTFTYNLGLQSAFSKDDRMIHFHATQPDTLHTPTATTKNELVKDDKNNDSETDIQLNFIINATPAAQIRIITDELAGDMITTYGNGTLRANWHNKGAFQLYGTYVVDRGQYNLSIQNIIRKTLTLKQGSNIVFGGNPLDADLALHTLYTVTGVPLSDLNYASGFASKTVRADCILDIVGKTRAPQVNFDLDLHNISSDEKQMVRQLISTQEDMSRQVIALLGVGRFLTTNTLGTSGTEEGTQQSGAAMRSFLSTTLTSQLNSAISSVLGNQSNWSFGTNFMPGTQGWNTMEVDGLLQGRLLNDRLIINGNFGYRDHPSYTSNFVGDFDIRYLLTPRGNISLRAYSETNDRYFTKSSLTTQGVGITLQRDFTNLGQLFRYKKKTKKTKENDKK